MLSQVIPRGLNSGLVQEAEMRNHVRSFGKGSFIHPCGSVFFFFIIIITGVCGAKTPK